MSEWSDLPHFERLALSANTPEERVQAARYIAANALDPDDCRQLLNAVGLLPATENPTTREVNP